MIDSDWGVFRCSGGDTLDLAADLARRGLEAYAPSITIMRRIPRTNSREQVDIAVLPTFLFVRAPDLEASGGVVLRRGSPMIFNGVAVLIPNSQIKEMDDFINMKRAIFEQRKGKHKTTAQKIDIEKAINEMPAFNIGDPVEVNSGPFKGIGAQVIKVHKEDIEIEFGGFLGKVRISTFLLSPKGV